MKIAGSLRWWGVTASAIFGGAALSWSRLRVLDGPINWITVVVVFMLTGIACGIALVAISKPAIDAAKTQSLIRSNSVVRILRNTEALANALIDHGIRESANALIYGGSGYLLLTIDSDHLNILQSPTSRLVWRTPIDDVVAVEEGVIRFAAYDWYCATITGDTDGRPFELPLLVCTEGSIARPVSHQKLSRFLPLARKAVGHS